MTKEEYLKELNKVENNYTVYMHKNKINGKVYIGITSQKPQNRWGSNGSKYKKGLRFYNAIQKYTWENFEHIILFEKLSKDKAEQKEIELIKQYKSNNANYGYNIANGGNSKGKQSEETKRKISSKNKGKTSWAKGKPMKQETKDKISKANKIAYKNKPKSDYLITYEKGHIPWNKDKKGIHLSPKTEFKKGNIPPFKNKKIPYEIYEHRCKKVLCIETGEIFKSVNEAQRIKKCRNISQVCKGVRKTSLGYHWRYYEE